MATVLQGAAATVTLLLPYQSSYIIAQLLSCCSEHCNILLNCFHVKHKTLLLRNRNYEKFRSGQLYVIRSIYFQGPRDVAIMNNNSA